MSKTVVLLYGLPGSGKTTYANTQTKSLIIDGDKLTKKKTGEEFLKAVVKKTEFCLGIAKYDEIIIDSLLTTNESAKKLIDRLREIGITDFKIVYWKEDRESCLFNDYGRRKKDSEITIKNLPFEKPDHKLLGIEKKQITEKTVVRKPAWKKWAIDNKLEDKFKSYEWCSGGTYGNCYADELEILSPDNEPDDFIELDDLLEKISPSITFLQYKKIYRECVDKDSRISGDHYGGTCYYSFYVCDTEKLYNCLVTMGLIKE